MSRPVMMTFANLFELFTGLGWEVINLLDKMDPAVRSMKGISLYAISPNGFVLSVQAGFGVRSDPNQAAHEYSTVEAAVWVDGGKGRKIGSFIRDDNFGTEDEVMGNVDFFRLRAMSQIIMKWSDRNPPIFFMRRKNTRWGGLS